MEIQAHEIAFDFDGVIADTFRLFVEMAKKDYSVEIDYEEITEYDFFTMIKMGYDDIADIFATITNHTHELDLKPNEGAADVLARLAEKSPPLSIVTARTTGDPVKWWFEKNIPQIRPDFISVNATSVSTAKLQVLKSSNTKFFVDDRLDTCQLLASEGITPIVYDQPWNRVSHGFRVVRNWQEISSLISWND